MFGGQLVVKLGSELASIYALDLSLYGEAVVATALTTAAVRVRYVWERCKALIGIPLRALTAGRGRPRSRRTNVRMTTRNSSANDDDHPWALSLRAA